LATVDDREDVDKGSLALLVPCSRSGPNGLSDCRLGAIAIAPFTVLSSVEPGPKT